MERDDHAREPIDSIALFICLVSLIYNCYALLHPTGILESPYSFHFVLTLTDFFLFSFFSHSSCAPVSSFTYSSLTAYITISANSVYSYSPPFFFIH
jgi:hypothetical protein